MFMPHFGHSGLIANAVMVPPRSSTANAHNNTVIAIRLLFRVNTPGHLRAATAARYGLQLSMLSTTTATANEKAVGHKSVCGFRV
jgi:hypothetical protein